MADAPTSLDWENVLAQERAAIREPDGRHNGPDRPLTGLAFLACNQWYDEKSRCLMYTGIYYQAVSSLGQGAWNDDQVKWCKCCP